MSHSDKPLLVEYAATSLEQIASLIDELIEQEQIVEQNKGQQGNRDARNNAEQQAEHRRRSLLNKADASILHGYFKTTNCADADALRTTWQKKSPAVVDQEWLDFLKFSPDLTQMSTGSFLIDLTFTLAKPYLSRDDNNFYIIDNPVVREKVFRWPMVRPSSWKGSLRHALWQLGYLENNEQIKRIFGETRSDDTGQTGRLYLYPTFFDQSGLEIINPHDRQNRVGKNPILLECVPAGTKGAFTLLYFPFDRIGENVEETRRQVATDLKLVVEGIQAMMTVYGFGAKISSGFGIAADSLRDGHLLVVGIDTPRETPPDTAIVQPSSALPRYLSAPGQLHADFQSADGSLVSEADYQQKIESRGQKYAKKDKQLYDKAKAWWEREGKALVEETKSLPEHQETPIPSEPRIAKCIFAHWDELQAKADELAKILAGDGA